MRRSVVLRRCVAVLVAIELVLVASYAAADLPLPVPVDGLSRVSVPRDFHAPRPGFTALIEEPISSRVAGRPFAPSDGASSVASKSSLAAARSSPSQARARLEAFVTSLPEHR